MLIRPRAKALIVECKYSADSAVVGRGGYEQTLAYIAEAATALAPEVVVVVVAPAGVVRHFSLARTHSGHVGFCPVSLLPNLIRETLAERSSPDR